MSVAFGMLTDDKLVQFSKVEVPIAVAFFALNFSRVLQFLNALLSILLAASNAADFISLKSSNID